MTLSQTAANPRHQEEEKKGQKKTYTRKANKQSIIINTHCKPDFWPDRYSIAQAVVSRPVV